MQAPYRIYVAASSLEIARAKAVMAALARSPGIAVTSTWPAIIESVGDANPRDASREQRNEWAHNDLVEVLRSDLLWFLAPAPNGGAARGAYFELAYAHAKGIPAISSGDTRQSIFLARTVEFESDEDALRWIFERTRPV